MKLPRVFSAAMAAIIVAGGAWWALSPAVSQPPTAGSLDDFLSGLQAEDCWRKHPETDEMVCNYIDASTSVTYSVRFNLGNVNEVVRGSKLGGADKPPFNHRVETP